MTLEHYRATVRQAKRDAIVAAALAVFLRDGFARATMDAISAEAQVSLATLYKHFPTKAELFGGVMQATWAKWTQPGALPDASLGPAEGLRRIGLGYAELLAQPHVVALFRVVIAEVEVFPELGRELYEQGKKPWLELVQRFLRRGRSAGRFSFHDVEIATRQFAGMINDVLFWPRFLIKDLSTDPALAARVVDEAVATFLARYGVPDESGPPVRRRARVDASRGGD